MYYNSQPQIMNTKNHRTQTCTDSKVSQKHK